MIGQDLDGVTVLDAYGGTGLLGLEAWSRGASVTVVEREASVARAIQRSAHSLGADVDVRVADVENGMKEVTPFALVLADPPYARDPREVLARLERLVGCWLVLETASGRSLPEHHGSLILERRRAYGRTEIWVYMKREAVP